MLPIDSAGVRIVESDPSSSDATCTIGEEPSVVIGDDETDERQWFLPPSGGRDGCRTDPSWQRTARPAKCASTDETGGHLRSMGRKGEGPGEFDDPFQLWGRGRRHAVGRRRNGALALQPLRRGGRLRAAGEPDPGVPELVGTWRRPRQRLQREFEVEVRPP